ncbi:hypothetical protein EDB80DRAFT_516065, partial [Ilyonectria destructans]
TPLLLAIKNGNKAIVKLLLATEGVDVNLTGHSGQTPLFEAAINANMAIVELLIAAKGIDADSK